MMVIPFRVSETQYSLYVILGKENLQRIAQYDPAEVTLDKLGEPFAKLTLKDVVIGYATDDEQQQVVGLCASGQVRQALRMISRGFRFRPTGGDYDGPYLSLKDDGKGPKQ